MRFSLWRILALAAILLYPKVTEAWDSSFVAAPSLPSRFVPTLIADPDSTGFWAGGTANEMSVLVRYNGDGSVKFARYPSASALSQGDFVQFHALAKYPDGGVVEIDSVNNVGDVSCYTRRFDANGRLLWSVHQCGDARAWAYPVKVIQIDGAGNIWVRNGPRIAPDGTLLTNVRSDAINGGQLVDPNSDAVYAYGCIGYATCRLDSTSTTATIQKITPQGVAWTLQAPQGSNTATALENLAVGSDGNLYGYGIQLPTGGGIANLYGMSASATGNLRWLQTFPINLGNGNIFVAAGHDGQADVLSIDFLSFLQQGPNSTPTIASISSAGILHWQKPAGFQPPVISSATYFDSMSSTLSVAGNGDVVATLQYSDAGVSPRVFQLQQSRLDAEGNVLYAGKATRSGSSNSMSFALLPDSSSLAIDSAAFRRLDRNGNALMPPQTVGAVPAASWDIAEGMGSDGSVYLLTANGSTNSYAMTAYSKDGAQIWSTALTAKTDKGVLTDATVIVRTADVCFVSVLDAAQIAQCYSQKTGVPSMLAQLAAGISADSQRWSASGLANDQLLVLYSAADGSVHHSLLDAQLHVLHDVLLLAANETWGATSINTNGSALIQTSANSLVKFKVDGTRAYAATPDIASYILKLAEDESALLSQTKPGAVVERFDPAGKMVWKSALPLLSQSSRILTRSIRITADEAYFYLYDSPPIVFIGNTGPFAGYVVKLALNDGHMVWNSAFPYTRASGSAFVSPPTLFLDTDSQRMLLISSSSGKMMFQNISVHDGTELARRVEDMGVDDFALYDLRLTDDGALRLVNDTADTTTGFTWQVNTLLYPFVVPRPRLSSRFRRP